MQLTARESAVLALLREWRVGTMAQLRQALHVSHMTVVRGLKKYGYYSSFNENAAYYTLYDLPDFDDAGLWWYRDVGFSRHGTLTATLVALVESSPAGCTVAELEARLRTPVANLLCRICRAERLARTYRGRQVVYVSPVASQRRQQLRRRADQEAPAGPRVGPRDVSAPGWPAGLDPHAVITLLVEMIRRPEASDAALSQTVQGRGLSLTAPQVRQVVTFYELAKNRAL